MPACTLKIKQLARRSEMNMPNRKKEIKGKLFELKKLNVLEILDSQRLRYKVYVEEKGWEPPNEHKLEKDVYDDFSYHFGVYVDKELIGSARLIDGRRIGLPIFSRLSGREKNSVEISRVVVIRGVPRMLISEWIYSYLLYFFLLNRYQAAFAFMQEKHFKIMKFNWRKELNFKQVGDATNEYKTGYCYVPCEIRLNQEVLEDLFAADY